MKTIGLTAVIVLPLYSHLFLMKTIAESREQLCEPEICWVVTLMFLLYLIYY